MFSFSDLYQLVVEADMKPFVNKAPDVNDPDYRAKSGMPYQIGMNKSRQMRDVGAHLDRKKDKGYASNYDRPDEHPGMATSTGEEIQAMNNTIASEVYNYVSKNPQIFKAGSLVPVNTIVRMINTQLPTTKPEQIMQAIALLSNITKQKMHSPLFKYQNKDGMHMVEIVPYGNPKDVEHAHGGRYLNQKIKATQSEAPPTELTPEESRTQYEIARLVKEYKAQIGLNNRENAIKVAQQLVLMANKVLSNPTANPKLKATASQLREKLQNVA